MLTINKLRYLNNVLTIGYFTDNSYQEVEIPHRTDINYQLQENLEGRDPCGYREVMDAADWFIKGGQKNIDALRKCFDQLIYNAIPQNDVKDFTDVKEKERVNPFPAAPGNFIEIYKIQQSNQIIAQYWSKIDDQNWTVTK